MELRSFMPVFESGILLPEIDFITKEALKANPNASGVGQLRCDDNGNMGIYFGGVFQTFKFTDTDIRMAPVTKMQSNSGFNATTNKEVGGPFEEREINSAVKPKETNDSKSYRNANNDEG